MSANNYLALTSGDSLGVTKGVWPIWSKSKGEGATFLFFLHVLP